VAACGNDTPVTLAPRAVRAGCRLLPDTRVGRLVLDGRRHALALGRAPGGDPVRRNIGFRDLFLCAGAIQTPLLLRRSGVTRNVGDSLKMHPMVRVAARFPDPFNDPTWGVPVEQVEEFKPAMTLGCSHSSLPHVALWLTGDAAEKQRRLAEWRCLGVFYVAITGAGTGTVRNVPLFHEALVRFPLLDQDVKLLGEGLYRLGRLLFAAGAVEVFNPVEGGPALRGESDLEPFRAGIPQGRVNVTTIHLFCTARMGEDHARCPVDSWGRLRGVDRAYVNDASLLPGTPGVNPQGTILAIARRNALKYLGQV
jgi:choline dehydrogenase-like flavoprotein